MKNNRLKGRQTRIQFADLLFPILQRFGGRICAGSTASVYVAAYFLLLVFFIVLQLRDKDTCTVLSAVSFTQVNAVAA